MLPDQRINVSTFPPNTTILAATGKNRLVIMITRRDFASDKDIRLNLEVLALSPEDRNFMVEKYVEDRNSSDTKGFRKPMVLKNQKIEQGRARVSVLLKNHSVVLLNLKSY
jgi:hypothetical protein